MSGCWRITESNVLFMLPFCNIARSPIWNLLFALYLDRFVFYWFISLNFLYLSPDFLIYCILNDLWEACMNSISEKHQRWRRYAGCRVWSLSTGSRCCFYGDTFILHIAMPKFYSFAQCFHRCLSSSILFGWYGAVVSNCMSLDLANSFIFLLLNCGTFSENCTVGFP